jgi:hypothetical protein
VKVGARHERARPRNSYPLISLAQNSKTIFRRLPNAPELEDVKFDIPEKSAKRPLDWSYANTTALWGGGWQVGKKFVDKYGSHLPNRIGP